MTKVLNLNTLKSGINRLRTKGGADPGSLYDLKNAYVTISGSVKSRPGSKIDVTLPAGTKGLCAFHNKLLVFSNAVKSIGSSRYECAVLVNPNDAAQTIEQIHFAAPFMGYPYVVAEFTNGNVYHYWLRSGGAWQPDHFYKEGDIVEPSTPNGLAYEASGDDHPDAWQPGTSYAVGDEVQPTVYNGYKYRVVSAEGTNPSSGTVEPDWPESDGGQVVENVSTDQLDSAPTYHGGKPESDRYGNPGGSVPPVSGDV